MITLDTLKRGALNGTATFFDLAKIIVPVHIIITFMKHTVLLDLIAETFSPFMQIFGLPGEATLVLVLGNLINLYAGIGAIASLSLTPKQITIISIMLSFCHSLIIETSVCKKIEISLTLIVIIRIGLATLAGIIFNLIL